MWLRVFLPKWLCNFPRLSGTEAMNTIETSKPDYSSRDPKGWCGDARRGAAMGRGTYKGPADYAGRITLRRVHLDSGGYDTNGTYFGHGMPLYWYACEDGDIDGMLRANRYSDRAALDEAFKGTGIDTATLIGGNGRINRADARRQVLEMYPNAKVRR